MTPQQSCGASLTARIRGLRPLITPAIHPPSKLRGILAFFYKPSVLLEGAAPTKTGEIIADEEKRAMWRDWINFTKDIFEKQKELPYLMIDDIANMYKKRESVVGEQKGTPKGK